VTSIIPFYARSGTRNLSVLSLSATRPKIIQCVVTVSERLLRNEDSVGHRPARNIHYDIDIRCESSLKAGALRDLLVRVTRTFMDLPVVELPVQGRIVSWHARVQHGKQRYQLAGSQLFPSMCIMAYLTGETRGREQLRKAGFSSVSCEDNYVFTTYGDTLRVLELFKDQGYEPFNVQLPGVEDLVPSLLLTRVNKSNCADVLIVLIHQLFSAIEGSVHVNMTDWDNGSDFSHLSDDIMNVTYPEALEVRGIFEVPRDELLAYDIIKILRNGSSHRE